MSPNLISFGTYGNPFRARTVANDDLYLQRSACGTPRRSTHQLCACPSQARFNEKSFHDGGERNSAATARPEGRRERRGSLIFAREHLKRTLRPGASYSFSLRFRSGRRKTGSSAVMPEGREKKGVGTFSVRELTWFRRGNYYAHPVHLRLGRFRRCDSQILDEATSGSYLRLRSSPGGIKISSNFNRSKSLSEAIRRA